MKYLVILLAGLLLSATGNIEAGQVYRVDEVINGHTLLLSNAKKVRLIGIDASTEEGTAFVRDLVLGKGVKLEFDELKEDSDGNLLAYVLMIETFVNASVVYAGYATPQSMPPNTMHDELFRLLFENAKNKKRGLWNQTRDPIKN